MEAEFNIKAWRERMGLTQAAAAETLKTNFFTYRSWDQGHIRVPGNVEKLCEMLEEAK